MVRPEDEDEVGGVIRHEVAVLVDGVGRALEPELPLPLLGGDGGDEVLVDAAPDGPGAAQVVDEGLGLVLDQHVDGEVARVHQAAEDEIDDPVLRAEGDGGLAPLQGEGVEALPPPPGHDEAEDGGSGPPH